MNSFTIDPRPISPPDGDEIRAVIKYRNHAEPVAFNPHDDDQFFDEILDYIKWAIESGEQITINIK